MKNLDVSMQLLLLLSFTIQNHAEVQTNQIIRSTSSRKTLAIITLKHCFIPHPDSMRAQSDKFALKHALAKTLVLFTIISKLTK